MNIFIKLSVLSGKVFTIALAMLSLVQSGLQAQGMVIETKGGTRITETLNSIESLTFPDQFMVITKNDLSTQSFSLLSIKKIYFDNTVNNEPEIDPGEIFIYPNPARDKIRIGNPPESDGHIEIFSLQGRKVLDTEYNSLNAEIIIGNLDPGLYVIRIEGRTLKFVKQ